jgi:hypothetical protein
MTKKINFIFNSTILIITITILFMKVFLANKGLVIDDEAWFLLLIRDLPSGDAPTQFYKLFFNVFNGDIYQIRISYLFLEIVSYFTFSYGLYYFLKEKLILKPLHIFTFFALTLIGFSIFSLPICNIPYYANLNKTLIPLSIGFFLLANYKYTIQKQHQHLLYLAGLVVGFQAFIMITTVSIYLLFLILIYIYFKQKKITSCIYYCLGIITSVIIYFSFVESPIHFWEKEIIVNFKSYSTSDYNDQHGFLPIIRWLAVTFNYLIFSCLIPALAIIGYRYIHPFLNKTQKYFFYLILSIGGLVYLYFEIVKGEHNYAAMNLFIALLMFGLLDGFILKKKQLYIYPITIAILILPFLLSIGTDVDFKTRATDYIGMFFPFIYILLIHLKEKKKIIFTIVLFFYFMNYISMYYRQNWGHFKYIDQKTHVKSIGIDQKLKLNELNMTNLIQLKPFFNANESVVVSHKNLNGTCYLLNLKMIAYDFKLKPAKIIDRLNHTYRKDTLKMIESSYSKFDAVFLEDVQKLTAFKLIKVENVGIHNIFYFSRK